MPRNNQRGRNNNNPSGRNQYSSDWMGTVRDRPMATAAAAAAAVGAGVFLWSKRSQIGDQISRLSEQVTDWADEMRSGSGSSSRELAMTAGPNESSAIESSRATGSRSSRSTGSRSGRTTASRSSGANMNAGRSSTQATTH